MYKKSTKNKKVIHKQTTTELQAPDLGQVHIHT